MFVDVVLSLVFVVWPVLGYFQGIIRLVVLLVAFYVSLVLASLYFSALGNVFETSFQTTSATGSYIAFGLILLVSFVLLATANLFMFRHISMPKNLSFFDAIGGALVGVILSVACVGVLAVLLWNMMVEKGGSSTILLIHWLGGSVEHSFFLQLFSTAGLPRIYALADPLLPDTVRPIFIATE